MSFDSEQIAETVGLAIPFCGLALIWLWIVLAHRSNRKVLDILKSYAERGAEPPAEILAELTKRRDGGSPLQAGPSAAPPRAMYFASAVQNFVLAAGLIGLVVWLMPDAGPDFWAVLGSLFAIGFTANGLQALVAALLAPRNGG